MAQLVLASALFLGLHLLPSTPLRDAARARLGESVYLALFSIASIAGIAWMVAAYNAAGPAEPLWSTGLAWRAVTMGLMLLAFIGLVGGVATPNPSALKSADALEGAAPWRGIFAITRHPLMWAIGLWALLHLSNRPDAVSGVFFGSLALLAIAGAKLQEIRKRRQLGASWAAFEAHTSFLPFGAILSGRARLSIAEIGWWRIALGVVAWAAMLHFHGAAFGVSPLPL